MSAPRPVEDVVLDPVRAGLALAMKKLHATREEARLELLEALASRVGGFPLDEYRAIDRREYAIDSRTARAVVSSAHDALLATRVPASLALASLARPEVSRAERRVNGAYYTDFRLAGYLAGKVWGGLAADLKVLDPAAGTGILLAAVALTLCGSDRARLRRFVARSMYAADLSPAALRGAKLALASLTDDVAAIQSLADHLRCHDSLLAGPEAWRDVAPKGFDLVIGNPPWEKLKVTRHEFLQASGVVRNYGDEYEEDGDAAELESAKQKSAAYGDQIATLYPRQAGGELDLYRAFLEFSMRATRQGGQLALLVPAGLIRSQGTEALRRALLDGSSRLEFTVFDNKARFFEIDTRFKFLAVHAELGARGDALHLRYARGTDEGITETSAARLEREALVSLRRDLTVPEVRDDQAWHLFRRMCERGKLLEKLAPDWRMEIVREVDMTRDRAKFAREREGSRLPVIEGRMVHQYRFGAKSYVSGTGRSAAWSINPLGDSKTNPQFWIRREDLPTSVAARITRARVGFCDITGQTNERSMLAALVPPGAVCGNKVPTITFANESLAFLFLAVANSLPFDWLLRRVVTTTVNYFVLLGLPFPALPLDGVPARRLIALARELVRVDAQQGEPVDAWTVAEMRAEIDAQVATAYGVDGDVLEDLLGDFPLIDRGQPSLPGESSSTVTRDLFLLKASELSGRHDEKRTARVTRAKALGAMPYTPAEFAYVQVPTEGGSRCRARLERSRRECAG